MYNNLNLKKLATMFIVLIMLSFLSCAKSFTKEDFDKMPDKTFYLMPMQSIILVGGMEDQVKIMDRVADEVIKGVKAMDVNKIASSLEKRYGIKVDTSYFEKVRKDETISKNYFEAIRNKKTEKRGMWEDKYTGSDFYKEISKINDSKSTIIISHDTRATTEGAYTTIKITLMANSPASKGQTFLGRLFSGGRTGDGGFISTGVINYTAIYESIAKMADFKYREGGTNTQLQVFYIDGSM